MKKALDSINERILEAIKRRRIPCTSVPRLIAVSKLKPTSAIIEAYECGQRVFGENYIQELVDKSNSPDIIEKCPDIRFHFIGHLQSNKVNKLMKVRNLQMMETVDSAKLADLLHKAIAKLQMGKGSGDETNANSDAPSMVNQFPAGEKLKVMIQINTSGEEQKNGVQPETAADLAEHIKNKCHWLHIAGLMTIGRLDGWPEGEPSKDFQRMLEMREVISKRLSREPSSLELSMGMSGDFEEAIEMGSTSVRIGTAIFGARPPKN